jgi:hypothetical protein
MEKAARNSRQVIAFPNSALLVTTDLLPEYMVYCCPQLST